MSDYQSKRYYWLKLHKDFFQGHVVRVLEGMPNGREYAYFWLKLLAESVSHEGRLRLNDAIPYSEEMLAAITNTNIDIVRSAVKVLKAMNMLEIMDDGTYYMTTVQDMIGSETHDAERKRIERLAKKTEAEDKRGQCPDNVGNIPQEIRYKSIEIRDKNNIYMSDRREIIDYLNQKTGKSYSYDSKDARHIDLRLQKHSKTDLIALIDKMYSAWHGTDFEGYLRPSTLFVSEEKYDKYANWSQPKKTSGYKDNAFIASHNYDYDEIMKEAHEKLNQMAGTTD